MGQEASCCGSTEKTTRSGGKVKYGDNKKRHVDSKKAPKAREARSASASGTGTCKFSAPRQSKFQMRVLQLRALYKSQISKS
jgi:hypothetical protein